MGDNKREKIPHFDISASVVKQLGEELVTDEVTAIMELVKNSYDADANWVSIEINTGTTLKDKNLFFEKQDSTGYIVIEDDGFGMSREDIMGGWLNISFSSKKKMRKEGLLTPKGRMPLGEKGLGRLSTQKLGYRLEMFTSKKENKKTNHLAFSWNDFNENIRLSDVEVKLEELQKINNSSFTKLVISELNSPDVWLGKSADKIKGQLSQLIFPYKNKRPFSVLLKINGKSIELDELHENARKLAVSKFDFDFSGSYLTIRGEINYSKLKGNKKESTETLDRLIVEDNGRSFFDFLTDKKLNNSFFLNNIDYVGTAKSFFTFKKSIPLSDFDDLVLVSNNKIADPGKFYGEIDDYSFNSSDATKNVFNDFAQFKTIIQNQVGVRIYRDGFGIKPFGIIENHKGKLKINDWLGLSSGQTSGSSFYGLRPGNIIGFVSLSAIDNYVLKEKTDREGFMDDSYSKNFFILMDSVIREINKVLEKTRRSYNEYKKNIAAKDGDISSPKLGFKALRDTGEESKIIANELEVLDKELKDLSPEIKKISSKLKEPLFASEEENKNALLIKRVDEQIDKAKDVVTRFNDFLSKNSKFSTIADYLEPTLEGLEYQLSEFSQLAGLGMTAEALSHEIAHIADRLALEADKTSKQLAQDKFSKAQILTFVEFVKSAVSTLRKQLSHLAPSLKYVREKSEIIDMDVFTSELVDYFESRFGNNKISFEVESSESEFKIKFNKGKLTQIFDNLILNSEYWLNVYKERNPNFNPKVSIRLKPPLVQVLDNGLGISPKNSDLIFQPFISNKSAGRGLGLFIIEQFLSAEGCSIFLRSDLNDYDNKYIFQLNFSNVTHG